MLLCVGFYCLVLCSHWIHVLFVASFSLAVASHASIDRCEKVMRPAHNNRTEESNEIDNSIATSSKLSPSFFLFSLERFYFDRALNASLSILCVNNRQCFCLFAPKALRMPLILPHICHTREFIVKGSLRHWNVNEKVLNRSVLLLLCFNSCIRTDL